MSKSKAKKQKGFYMSQNTIIAICLFVVIFAGLLITATFTDLQVSQILTKNSLPKGQYYADDIFGRTFETVGCSPIYLMLGFAFHIIFWNVFIRVKDTLVKYFLLAVSTGCGVAAYFVMYKDVLRYIVDQVGLDHNSVKTQFVTFSMIFMGCITCFLGTLAVRNFKDETLKKLLSFAIAVILIAAVANGLVNLIKIPMGRPRYRGMNYEGAQSIGGFKNFKRWYEATAQPDTNSLIWYYGSTDACKSFPSGHTCSAGMSYCLIMLIDALKITDKKKKIALWVCPIIFTGIVAVSRIMVGAHFFSDVLVGGTFAFVTMLLFREIFICKGSHFIKTK